MKKATKLVQKKEKRRPLLIGIQPIGHVRDEKLRLIRKVLDAHGLAHKTLRAATPPLTIKRKGKSMLSDGIHRWLKSRCMQPITHLFGVIASPIHNPVTDLWGETSGNVTVITVRRLRTLAGLRGLMLHEIVHFYDLRHCRNLECLMSAEGHPDMTGDWFCPKCRRLFDRKVRRINARDRRAA